MIGSLKEARIAFGGFAFIALALCVALTLLAGCATAPASRLTPAQSLYAAYSSYDLALSTANYYAASPTADPKIVHAMNLANKQAAPAVAFGKAFIACKGFNATPSAEVDCTFWDFRPQTVTAYAVMLRGAVAALAARGN